MRKKREVSSTAVIKRRGGPMCPPTVEKGRHMGLPLQMKITLCALILFSFSHIALAVVEETSAATEQYPRRRAAMVQEQLLEKGIKNQEVLDAMGYVPREVFLRPGLRFRAYLDEEIPTEDHLFLARPMDWAVAFQLLDIPPEGRVLVIDSGLGYAGAVASTIAKEVYVVVVNPEFLEHVEGRYKTLQYDNLFLKSADLSEGWQSRAPFDRILIAGVMNVPIPTSLFDQLAPDGSLLVPEGKEFQQWVRYTKGEQIDRVGWDRCHFPALKPQE